MIDSIKKIWNKNRIRFVIFITCIALIISALNFIFIFSITAQSNDECLWVMTKSKDIKNAAIKFDQVKVDGVTWAAGIRDGDILIAIDGKKVWNTFVATQILDKVQKGDYATYTVQRGDLVFDTPVLVKKLINFGGLASSLLATIWLIVGFIVFMAKPDGRTQRMFFKIGIVEVLLSMGSMLYRGNVVDSPIYRSPILYLLVDNLTFIAAAFIPFMIFHFFSIFPKDFSYVTKKWFPSKLYLAAFSLFIIGLALKIYFWYIKGDLSFYIIINNIFGINTGLGFVIGFILLWINYTRLKSKTERVPIFIILVAYFVGITANIYTSFIASAIAGLIFNNPTFFMPIFLIALLPIAFGYSIFRYSLMDVSIVIKNAIVYGVATASLAGIYFLLIYVVGQNIGSALSEEYQGIIAGLVFVVFAVVFQSTKDKFQELLTQKFYPEQFAFQKNLLKFSSDVASIVGMENILDSTLNFYVRSLKLKKFGIMLKSINNNIFYQVSRQEGFYNSTLRIYDEKHDIEKYFLEQSTFGKKLTIEQQDFKTKIDGRFSVLIDEEIYTVIPLVIKSKIVGLLLFGLKYSGSQFSGKDIDLLISAASQTALSLENARLYESESEKMKIERDLENARIIQESLIPKIFPKIDRLDIYGEMISAMQVGGDYFDLIKLSDKKLFVVIGDVSGKGLSASLYMSKLQTMVRLYCREDKSPKQVLSEINQTIFSELEKHWFITVSLALIDLEKNQITFCRAGHTPLIKINSNIYELYQSGGVGIGLNQGKLFESSLEEITLSLKSGDLFFFFSDGITELMNNKNELYGIERLKKILQVNCNKNTQKIGQTLVEDLDSYREETSQYDDITFVIIKITS